MINPSAHTWSQYGLNSAASFLSMAEWRTDCMSIGDFLNQCIAVALNIRSTPRERPGKKHQTQEKFGRRNRVINCVIPDWFWKMSWLNSVSRSTNTNGDFGLIWIWTMEFDCFDLVDFGRVKFPAESVLFLIYLVLYLHIYSLCVCYIYIYIHICIWIFCSYMHIKLLCVFTCWHSTCRFTCYAYLYIHIYVYLHIYLSYAH